MVDLDNINTCKSLRYNQAPGRFPRYVITNHRVDQSLDQFIPICSPLSYGVARSIKSNMSVNRDSIDLALLLENLVL